MYLLGKTLLWLAWIITGLAFTIAGMSIDAAIGVFIIVLFLAITGWWLIEIYSP